MSFDHEFVIRVTITLIVQIWILLRVKKMLWIVNIGQQTQLRCLLSKLEYMAILAVIKIPLATW